MEPTYPFSDEAPNRLRDAVAKLVLGVFASYAASRAVELAYDRVVGPNSDPEDDPTE